MNSVSQQSSGQRLRPYASQVDNFGTIILGLWLIIGVFIDGFAHNNLRGTIESFFTPWHGILYSGFVAAAIWTMWLVIREIRRGHTGLAAIPVGYELGLLGVFIFGVGGIGDLIWHQVFGIETDGAALLSPTHLLLLTGGTLLVTSPLRSSWAALGRTPGFIEFLPTLLSSLAAFSFASFFHLYGWGLTNVPDGMVYMDWLKKNTNGGSIFVAHASYLAAVGALFSNVIIISMVLFLLRRWQTPFGTFLIIFTLNTTGMAIIGGAANGVAILASALAGLFADVFIAWRKLSNKNILEFRALALLLPLVIWGLHYLMRHLTGGIALEVEYWTGITLMTGLSGLVLSLLILPPELPKGID